MVRSHATARAHLLDALVADPELLQNLSLLARAAVEVVISRAWRRCITWLGVGVGAGVSLRCFRHLVRVRAGGRV